MQDISVKQLFQEQLSHYSRKIQSTESPIIALVLDWLKQKNFKRKIEICEFGGGSGQLLNQIRKRYSNASFTVSEIIEDYKEYLASKEIKFVKTSILDSKFPEKSFDVLIIRDVLHHLVGKTYTETRNNQKSAFKQLKRLISPGGAIFIEEIVNESRAATVIIYYLSKINSIIGIKNTALHISPNAVVSFLTSSQLLNLCGEIFGEKNIVKKDSRELLQKWYFKVIHLGSKTRKVTLIIQND